MAKPPEQPDPILFAFGRSVRRHRERCHISQEELGEEADLDQTYISGIECGKRNPGIKNVARIARALRVSTSELCRGVEA